MAVVEKIEKGGAARVWLAWVARVCRGCGTAGLPAVVRIQPGHRRIQPGYRS